MWAQPVPTHPQTDRLTPGIKHACGLSVLVARSPEMQSKADPNSARVIGWGWFE